MGLTGGEDALNNKSTRDPTNFHQHVPSNTINFSNNSKRESSTSSRQIDIEKVSDDEAQSRNSQEDENPKRRKVERIDETSIPRTSHVSQTSGHYSTYVARPVLTMKGHTAFLTFAVRSLTD